MNRLVDVCLLLFGLLFLAIAVSPSFARKSLEGAQCWVICGEDRSSLERLEYVQSCGCDR